MTKLIMNDKKNIDFIIFYIRNLFYMYINVCLRKSIYKRI